MTTRSRWFATSSVAVALVLSACAGGGDGTPPLTGEDEPSAGDGEVVRVVDDAFEPDQLEVPAGTNVTWSWEGHAPHDVVGDDFDSGVLRRGATFDHTFDEPGTYDYVCTLHRGMAGRVEVVAP